MVKLIDSNLELLCARPLDDAPFCENSLKFYFDANDFV